MPHSATGHRRGSSTPREAGIRGPERQRPELHRPRCATLRDADGVTAHRARQIIVGRVNSGRRRMGIICRILSPRSGRRPRPQSYRIRSPSKRGTGRRKLLSPRRRRRLERWAPHGKKGKRISPVSKRQGQQMRPVHKAHHAGCLDADSQPKGRKYRSFGTGFAGLKPILRLISGFFWRFPGGGIRKLQCGRSGGAPQIRLFALWADPFARPSAFERISTHQTPTRLYLVNFVRLRLLVVFLGFTHD